MKTSKIIIRALISGKVKPTSEVLVGLGEIIRSENTATKPSASHRVAPSAPPLATPAPSAPKRHRPGARRLILVSPLPGRWIRRTGCVLTAGLVTAGSLMLAAAAPGAAVRAVTPSDTQVPAPAPTSRHSIAGDSRSALLEWQSGAGGSPEGVQASRS